jgi:ribosome biogenesis GTPase
MYRSLRLSGFFICEQNQTEGLHDRMIGRILRAMSGFYWVETAEGVLECRLRGRLKRIEQQSEIAVIGDLVEVVVVSPGQGAIEAVHERTTRLSRVAVGSRGHKEDLIVANVDLVIVVVALANPEFHPRMLDRYLMICAHNDLEARIVASKADLVSAEYAAQAMAPYAQIGYETQTISTQTGEGLDVVKHWLPGRISVVTGKSGVGKSSLLNAINPDLALSVGAVSTTLNKGRHTTTMAQLIPLGNGGYVADTPGIREIALWNIPQDQLEYGFREFEPYLGECRFGNCVHQNEPDCAIRGAVRSGAISQVRYDSYIRLLNGEE